MNSLNSQFGTIGKAIQFAEQNHHVISQNVANINTPGFRAKELDFDSFAQAIEQTDGNVDGIKPTDVAGLQARVDGNNVDLDQEVAKLKKNSMGYQTLVQIMSTKMGMMNRAING